MIETEKTCFFSGHRILPAIKKDKIISLLERSIIEKYNAGITDFISGGALGFDTIAAQTVIRLKENLELYGKMRLILFLPCYDSDINWNIDDQNILSAIKFYADSIEVIEKSGYTSTCLKNRNRKMVESSCCGIVYKTTNHGGTGQTVAIAKSLDRPVINLADYFKTENCEYY